MGKAKTVWHGGDLGEARRLFPEAPQPWIDLSTGINPVPYPLPRLDPEAFTRLPSPSDLAALESAAAASYGCAPADVVAAPGTQALIELLPRLRRPGRVAVLGPTYAEHARAWARGGHDVQEACSLEEVPDADVLVVVNPNNPDGRTYPRAVLAEAAARLAGRGGWLLADEAFADLDDTGSLAPAVPAGVVVLRSFGKTFGLAGVRLGFAVARPEFAEGLRAGLGPWAVSGPAIAIGCQAFADLAWREEARHARAEDARRLDGVMRHAAALVGGTRLFRCYTTPAAAALFRRLGERGIWIRRFQDEPDRLRLGLPGSEAEWARLEEAVHGFAAGVRAATRRDTLPR